MEYREMQNMTDAKLSTYQMERELPNWVVPLIDDAWYFACEFMGVNPTEYAVPPMRFSYSARFDKFQWGNPRYFGGHPYIRLVKRRNNTWKTYDMKSLGITANRIPCPNKKVRMEFQLVHEFVHAIQHKLGKTMSEVETTRAELKLAREKHPELYSQVERI